MEYFVVLETYNEGITAVLTFVKGMDIKISDLMVKL